MLMMANQRTIQGNTYHLSYCTDNTIQYNYRRIKFQQLQSSNLERYIGSDLHYISILACDHFRAYEISVDLTFQLRNAPILVTVGVIQ
nr:unnamed protein product [Callosobruchus analis]